ncbi:hypothetical protein RUND412_008471, partial [Rhizina undulata]
MSIHSIYLLPSVGPRSILDFVESIACDTNFNTGRDEIVFDSETTGEKFAVKESGDGGRQTKSLFDASFEGFYGFFEMDVFEGIEFRKDFGL